MAIYAYTYKYIDIRMSLFDNLRQVPQQQRSQRLRRVQGLLAEHLADDVLLHPNLVGRVPDPAELAKVPGSL